MLNKIITKEKIVYGVVLFVMFMMFSAIYFNRYITDSYCWNEYNVSLLLNGQMPYRDYTVYYPPLLIVKYGIIWKIFGQQLQVILWSGLLERSILFLFIYLILSKWFEIKKVFISVCFSFLILLCCPFDTCGDYSWLAITVSVIAVYFYQLYFYEKEGRQSFAYLCWGISHFLIIQVLMAKQSTGLVLLFAMTLLDMIYYVCKRGKKIRQEVLIMLVGYIVGILPWYIWLKRNNAWTSFVEQVFIGGLNSKGVKTDGASTTFIATIFSIFSGKYMIYLLIFLFLLWGLLKKEKKNVNLIKNICIIGGVLFVEDIVTILFQVELWNSYFWTIKKIVILFIFVLFLYKKYNGNNCVLFGSVFYFTWLTSLFLSKKELDIISSINIVSSVETIVSHTLLVASLALCVFFLIKQMNEKAQLNVCWSMFSFIVLQLVFAFSTLLSSGDLSYIGMVSFINVPFFICILLSVCHGKKELNIFKWTYCLNYEKCINVFLVACLCYFTLITTTTKINSPYSWWGINVDTITDEDCYTIDYELYNGLLVSKDTKIKFEQIGKLIELNSDKNDYVLCFPYSVIYKLQTDRYTQPTKNSVYFFDVCSDKMAIDDLEIIKENNPKIIVWGELGEECWTVHEELFRGGNRCGQRDIQDWFDLVKKSKYELIGKIDNQSVYRLKDGTPINYTYFEDDSTSDDIEESKGNLHNSEYIYKFCILLGDKLSIDRYLIYYVLCGLIILCCIIMFLFGNRVILLVGILCSLFMILPCKPITFAGLILPIAVIITKEKYRMKYFSTYVIPMGITVAFSFTGWWEIWDDIGQYICCICVIYLFLFALFDTFEELYMNKSFNFYKIKNMVSENFIHFILAAIMIILCIFNTYVKNVELCNMSKDFDTFKVVCEDITKMVESDMFYENLAEYVQNNKLPKLGADGESLSDLSDFAQQYGYGLKNNIIFTSRELKKFSDGNIYIRISGEDIFVWIQESKQGGNSGWSISVEDYNFYYSNVES